MKSLPFYKRIIQEYEKNELHINGNQIFINGKQAYVILLSKIIIG